ncbi:hypothetical protein J1605_019935 [Eschrichtius robustus]|uniref:Uncharacterized protein n=1 Tax=Eschrichtius robustus TaxID=9764 RepID=A0AB34HP98_ESCRO|nr:hypothetical protein J1605_019935 [Eschrichtius robustus]
MCIAAHVTRLPPAPPAAPARPLADVEGLRRRRRPASEARGLRAPVSAHLARGRAPGCVTLSRCSRDARGEGPSTSPPWVCGWCTMDDFALGNFTVADYALLEECPYVDDCVFASEFMSNDYVRVTQLYCDGVSLTSALCGVVNLFLSCKITVMPLKYTSSGHFCFNVNTVL